MNNERIIELNEFVVDFNMRMEEAYKRHETVKIFLQKKIIIKN